MDSVRRYTKGSLKQSVVSLSTYGFIQERKGKGGVEGHVREEVDSIVTVPSPTPKKAVHKDQFSVQAW